MKTYKNMKKSIITIICGLFCLSMFAQRDVIPVKWKDIKHAVKKDADNVKKQVERLSAVEFDTLMTFEERILAFYGQSVLLTDRGNTEVRRSEQSFNKKDYKNALAQAEAALAINPLNIRALRLVAYSIPKLLDAKEECKYTIADGQVFYNRMMRCLNTIAATGLGTEKAPFYVTSIDDEYEFMRFYLDIWEYKSQRLIGDCDVFNLGETSEYYSQPTLYFNCERVLELELEMFK